MDIYTARNIQNLLYRESQCSRKRMKTIFDSNGKLYYTISHYFGTDHIPLYQYKERIHAILRAGIDIEIGYIDNIPGIPKGIYLIEIIPID